MKGFDVMGDFSGDIKHKPVDGPNSARTPCRGHAVTPLFYYQNQFEICKQNLSFGDTKAIEAHPIGSHLAMKAGGGAPSRPTNISSVRLVFFIIIVFSAAESAVLAASPRESSSCRVAITFEACNLILQCSYNTSTRVTDEWIVYKQGGNLASVGT